MSGTSPSAVDNPVEVLFSMYGMGAGGAERVISIMANHWSSAETPTCLVTWAPDPSFYSLHKDVEHIKLSMNEVSTNPFQAVLNNSRRMMALRRIVKSKRPRAVISFMNKNNVRTLLACKGLGIPVVVSERNETTFDPLSLSWRRLVRLTYPWASRIVVQSERAKTQMPSSWPITVIPNPIPKAPPRSADLSTNHHVVIAMGRLDHQKGFDLLISAFSTLAHRYLDWTLIIYGEGQLRSSLENQITDLKLENRIRLPGQTSDPSSAMYKADIFVLSSRYEGFPNVLGEAMAHGLAVLSFDCPNGPREIIQPDINGILVHAESVSELSAQLETLMMNPSQRQRLGLEAVKVTQQFSEEKVMSDWDRVLQEVPLRKRVN